MIKIIRNKENIHKWHEALPSVIYVDIPTAAGPSTAAPTQTHTQTPTPTSTPTPTPTPTIETVKYWKYRNYGEKKD